jgi:hypothetical protein
LATTGVRQPIHFYRSNTNVLYQCIEQELVLETSLLFISILITPLPHYFAADEVVQVAAPSRIGHDCAVHTEYLLVRDSSVV